MTRLYQQPWSDRFGTALERNLASDEWNRFDAAVAWVRRSGVRHLEGSLRTFLKRDTEAVICVGLDFRSTSFEGLELLVQLTAHGNLHLFVCHNEARSVFHPKLYLFSSDSGARLIVGSNNLTEAGLFRNVEAGLELDGKLTDEVITQAQDALASWTDKSTGLTKCLDAQFLEVLLKRGYVKRERDMQPSGDDRREEGPNAGKEAPLFEDMPIAAPAAGVKVAGGSQSSEPEGGGQVVLMRVRTARRTQVQFPLRIVRESSFFAGVDEIISLKDGRAHGLNEARASGKVNTLKVEIPEAGGLENPVLRLSQTDQGVVYDVCEASTPQGRQIMSALEAGRASGDTFLTLPNDPQHSTWVLFV